MNDLPRWMTATAWIICLVCQAPALYRIACRRARMLDPIWGLAFLLVLNRLSWVFHLSPLFSHVTGVVLALSFAAMRISYQRADKGASSGNNRA